MFTYTYASLTHKELLEARAMLVTINTLDTHPEPLLPSEVLCVLRTGEPLSQLSLHKVFPSNPKFTWLSNYTVRC